MSDTLAESYSYCERLARSQAGNFYHAFRLLPRPERRSMCALYAFLRVADDLSDAPGNADAKRGPLEAWREQLHAMLAGRYRHPLHAAFHDTIQTHQIPPVYLEEALDGVAMDLSISHYDTFEDLYKYCYRVASVVGLSCIHIWGFEDEEAKKHAESAGIAFQLTNILRDLAEDAGRGRIYLPREDLERFGYREDDLRQGVRNDRFKALMDFQVERAYGFYRESLPLTSMLQPCGRAVFQVMLRTYRGLLDEIVRRQYDVFSGRVRLSTSRKLWLALQALPVRWGWA